MGAFMKCLKRTGIVVILLIVAGIILLGVHLQRKKPNRNQTLFLKGVKEQVDVIYDEYGIPHIYARSDEDMYRAFGYVHAQDRLFQMELMRRLGQGRMAELFGDELLKYDIMIRTLQLNRFVEQWLTQMEKRGPQKMMAAIDAYLSGVNQFIAQGPTPVEFEILGYSKRPFTRVDVAAVAAYISFSMTGGLKHDILTTELLQVLGKEYARALADLKNEETTRLADHCNGLFPLVHNLSGITDDMNRFGPFYGSNAWLMAPWKTESGRAMLVNDPHMGFSQPSIWYEAHLVSPESELYGHHPGLMPFASLGHNQHMAWGLTMFINDEIDLYREKINPENPNQYWAVDHWENFEISKAVIKIKGGKERVLTLRKSRHGPIITDAFIGFDDGQNPCLHQTDPLALWWKFYDTDNDFLCAFYELPRTRNVRQAARAVSKIYSPGLNILYADRHGDIAWWAAARLPIRPSHVNSTLILDGASGKDDILGFHPFSDNPHALNPESGIIFSANNNPGQSKAGKVPGYYPLADRAHRIRQLLFTSDDKWNAEKMKPVLLDATNSYVPKIRQIVVPVLLASTEIKNDKTASEALAVFKAWQGDHDPEKIGATVYYYFQKHLMRRTMKDEMGEHRFGFIEGNFLYRKIAWTLLTNPRSPWWDDIKTPDIKESIEDIICAGFQDAVKTLTKKFGTDMAHWKWKHAAKLSHPHPLGRIPLIGNGLNVGTFSAPGGNGTINNLKFDISKPDFLVNKGPSTRRIIDFGHIHASLGINPTGQSGVCLDKHYDDQAQAFAAGNFRPQYTLKQDILAHQEGAITILPHQKEEE